MDGFLKALQERRSCYALSKESPVSGEALETLIRQAVKHTPSAFNMQSGRAVLLLGAHHDKLWQITLETLAAIVPQDRFAATEQKIAGFAAGHGTVLFFDDAAVTGNPDFGWGWILDKGFDILQTDWVSGLSQYIAKRKIHP